MADSYRYSIEFEIAFRFKKKLLIPKFNAILHAKQFLLKGLEYGRNLLDVKLSRASDDAVDEILLGRELISICQRFEKLLECITGNVDAGTIILEDIAGEKSSLLREVETLVKSLVDIANIAEELKEKSMSGSVQCHWKRAGIFSGILIISLLAATTVNADKYSSWGLLAAMMVLSFPFSAGWRVLDEYMRRRNLEPLGEKAQLADSIGNAARVFQRMGSEAFTRRK